MNRWAWPVALGVAAVLLLAAALLNGGAVYFPDTSAYVTDADLLVHLRPPWIQRPMFYGLVVWPFSLAGKFWGALFLQALLVAAVLRTTLWACGAALRPVPFVALVAFGTVLTPVSWHVSHLLPDIVVAMVVPGAFLLGLCGEAIGVWEWRALFLLLIAAISFHVTAVPIALALGAVLGVARWGLRLRTATPWPVLGALVVAVAGSLAFNAVIWQRVTLAANQPPTLLARVISDGPGRDYLDAVCPRAGLQLCRDRAAIGGTEEKFLWEYLPRAPYADGKRVKAEAGRVIAGTLAMFPGQVAWHAVANSIRQLLDIRSDMGFTPEQWPEFEAGTAAVEQVLDNTRRHDWLWFGPLLPSLNAVQAVVAVGSAVAGAVLLVACWRRGKVRPAALLALVYVALLVNAAACGAASGVFGRYQGRMIWLLPFAATAASISLRRADSRLLAQ